MIVAATIFITAWAGAIVANKIPGSYLRLGFGIFVLVLRTWLVADAVRKLGWL